MINISQIREDFPILGRQIQGKRLVYLDNAATTQKPWQVLEAMDVYYCHHNANIHRGIHTLAEEATKMYEDAREKIRAFINAGSLEEVVFVRNATEALNLLAQTWGMANIHEGDVIVLTEMEHHANLLPWQRVASIKRATLKFIPVTLDGLLQLDRLEGLITERTKLVTLPHVSNVLGTINPIKLIVERAHQVGAAVVVDAAQSVPHMPVDVQDLGADFVVFSGHKMLGPTGIGVLYGNKEKLEQMEPFLVGGEMIREVSYEAATWHDLPWKFEAGTPNIAGAIGLGVAVEYLSAIGLKHIREHEELMVAKAMEALDDLEGVTVYGPVNPEIRGGVVTFNLDGIHAHDVASILDREGVAIRSGHHCAQPLIKRMGLTAAARASFYLYNDIDDIDALVRCIRRVREVFGSK
jgi:cysteine desulfurase/selenocysteine lyase